MTSLVLRMTREEIGACLGLKLETVSRAFSRLHDDGLLKDTLSQAADRTDIVNFLRWIDASTAPFPQPAR